jgi:hypothetical protein
MQERGGTQISGHVLIAERGLVVTGEIENTEETVQSLWGGWRIPS